MTSARNKLKELYDTYDRDPQFEYLREDDINFVPGTGVLNPTAMLIGEAPGSMENARCIPFVGKAGIELGKLLEKAKIDIAELYFTNILKYWPRTVERKSRAPSDTEIQMCRDYIKKEIEIVNPRFVGLCGRIPTRAILPNVASIRSINGQLLQNKYIPLYHPAVVLYKPDKKDEVLAGYKVLASLISSIRDRH